MSNIFNGTADQIENIINKVTVVDKNVTDEQYPNAKAVMDYVEQSLFTFETLFNKVVCIGDSLTRGYQIQKNDKYTDGHNRDYGYPEYLARMTQLQTVNYGYSGSTPTTWYDTYKNADFSSYDCAIICLGRNGDLSSEEDITNYNNIITKLKTDNEHMTIFICSLPPSKHSASVDEAVNLRIKGVADANNLPYLDIFNDSYCEDAKYRNDYDGVHFHTLGYVLLAKTILKKLNLYINEHEEDFIELWVPKTKPARI